MAKEVSYRHCLATPENVKHRSNDGTRLGIPERTPIQRNTVDLPKPDTRCPWAEIQLRNRAVERESISVSQ